jgi:pyruvate-formate lyase-activating enzyme
MISERSGSGRNATAVSTVIYGEPVATVSGFLTVVFSSGHFTCLFCTNPASWEKTTVRKPLTVATACLHPSANWS